MGEASELFPRAAIWVCYREAVSSRIALCLLLFIVAACDRDRAESAALGDASAPATHADAENTADAGVAESDAAAAAKSRAATPRAREREVVIAASGDIMIHRRVLEAAEADDARFRGILSALGEAIREVGDGGDLEVITMLNAETPLTEEYNPPFNANPPVLGAPPELAEDLRSLGVDLLSLANNHALDQTAAGLVDTIAVAKRAGLGVIGASTEASGALAPWIAERAGLRVGFIGAAGHVNGGVGRGSRTPVYIARLRDEEALLAAIASLRPTVDVVVVAAHWSHDFVRQPLRSQRELARRMAEAGADVILGTGPHVLQEVERLQTPRGETVVAYSLGNVISNQGLRYRAGHKILAHEHPVAITPGTRDVVLFTAHIRAPQRGQVEIARVAAVTMWNHNNFWERRGRDDVTVDIRLRRLRDLDEALREERLAAVGATLGEAVELVP
jgi:poly-gamma-glutamate capsule biosynthesis protein CapA/YwtB (metallophosphatase superfamily)